MVIFASAVFSLLPSDAFRVMVNSPAFSTVKFVGDCNADPSSLAPRP